MKITTTVFQSLFTLILLLSQSLAFAAIPTTLDYQGHLTDSAGAPVDGAVNVTFQIYNVSAGGLSIWADTYAVTVNQGVFSAELGAAPNPIPAGFFEVPLWIGITVAPDLDEMIPRRPITTNGYSFKAGDANTLEGISASALDQSAHVGNNSNPHSVTAAQTGAASAVDITNDIATHSSDAAAHHAKTSSFVELTGQSSDAQIPALIARDAEIMSTVLANDGPASTLNADLLDGLSSNSFMSSAVDNWVNTTGDTMSGFLTVGGPLTIDSTADIKIYDSFNGLRWYDTDKVTQFGAILMNSTKNEFYDDNQNRPVFYSSANGIGIGTNAPIAGYAVTIPSLNITDSALTIGPANGSTFTYNMFRSSTVDLPVSNDMTSPGDLFIGYDLEVGGEIYADRFLYMNGNNSTGADADQTIYFYDANSRQGEHFRWDDSESLFDISSTLRTQEDFSAVGDYRYSTPRTSYVSIGPAAFRNMSDTHTSKFGMDFVQKGFVTRTGHYEGYIVADVQLPHSVDVSKFQCLYTDDSPDIWEFSAELKRIRVIPGLSPVVQTMATSFQGWADISDSSIVRAASTDTSISVATINNTNYMYWIEVHWEGITNTSNYFQRFYGCKLEYTTSRVVP